MADSVILIATVDRDETVLRLQASGEVMPVISQEKEAYGDAKTLWSDGEHVLFSGSDSVFGAEPWIVEEAGARRLADIYDGRSGSNPEILGVLGGKVLVWARSRDGTHFRRVSIAEGLVELVEDLPEEIEDHQFIEAVAAGSSAYLVSYAANAKEVLWLSRLDGDTQEVTTLGSDWLTEIDSYDAGWPYLCPQDDSVLLASWQTAFGEEVYRVDAGEDPVLVKDGNVTPIVGGRAVLIQPIPVSLDMQYFTVNTDHEHEYVRLRADGSTLTLRSGGVDHIGWSLTSNPQTGVSFFVDLDGLWSLLPGASAPRLVVDNVTVRPEFGATNVPFSVTTSGVLFLASNNLVGVGSTFHTDGFSSSSTKLVVPNQVFKDTPVMFKDFNYFVNDNPSLNVQPWFTNGTTTERFLTFSSEVIVAGATDSHIYFTADGPGDSNGIVLWSYTGSGSVLSVGAPAVSPFLVPPVSIDEHFYYVGFDESGAELWVSDGTSDGTIRLTDIQEDREFGAIKNLTAVDDVVFFAADDGEHGWELWTTDGTEEGTRRVTDLQEGEPDSLANTDVPIMAALGDHLYFAANDGIHGTELWRVDKAGNDPELIQDLMPGGASSYPLNFQIINGRLFFQADDPAQPMMTLREIVTVPLFESGSVNVEAADSGIVLTFGEKTNRSYLLMESDDLRTWRAVRSYTDAEAGQQQTVRISVDQDRSPVFYRVQSN